MFAMSFYFWHKTPFLSSLHFLGILKVCKQMDLHCLSISRYLFDLLVNFLYYCCCFTELCFILVIFYLCRCPRMYQWFPAYWTAVCLWFWELLFCFSMGNAPTGNFLPCFLKQCFHHVLIANGLYKLSTCFFPPLLSLFQLYAACWMPSYLWNVTQSELQLEGKINYSGLA